MEIIVYLVIRYTSFPFTGWMAELIAAGLVAVVLVVMALLSSLVLIPAAAVARWLRLRGLAAFFWAGVFAITIETFIVDGWRWVVPFSIWKVIGGLLATFIAGSVFGGLMALVAKIRGQDKSVWRPR